MIPLTNATLAYNDAEGLEVRDVGTLIVNRGLNDWIRAAEGEDLSAIPDIRVAAAAF